MQNVTALTFTCIALFYEAIEDVQAAMKGMLAPKYRELFYGRAECRQVYKISNVGIVMGST